MGGLATMRISLCGSLHYPVVIAFIRGVFSTSKEPFEAFEKHKFQYPLWAFSDRYFSSSSSERKVQNKFSNL